MNPRLTRLLACVFAGWLALFWLSYLFSGSLPEIMGYRKILPFPGWEAKDRPYTSAWLQKVSDWAIDHSPFHYQALVLRNCVLLRTTEQLPSLPINPGSVYVGGGYHGFLFFLGDSPGYRSQRQLEKIADDAVTFTRRMQATGRRVYFIPLPDKSSLYPEETGPVFRGLDARSRRRSLPEVLANCFAQAPELHDTYIPLWDLFRDAKKSSPELVYWKHCTHWTTRGYLMGVEQVLNRLQPGVFDPTQITSQEGADHYQGDLSGRMLLQQDFEVGPLREAHLSSDHPRVSGHVLFIGDSFFYMYYPTLLTPWFENISCVTPENRPALIPQITESDTIVLGIVERTLESRLSYLASDEFLNTVPPFQKK